MTDQYRRAVFLQEMGLGPVWSQRSAVAPDAATEDACPPESDVLQAEHMTEIERTAAAPRSAWNDAPNTAVPLPVRSPALSAADSGIARMDWQQLRTAVADCPACDLCKTRTQSVFGAGDQKAKWLFVGEGPGRNEDIQGLPFVGPAGKLLDNMLLAMGLKRGENTYIANIVKCRPTDAGKRDRPPTAEEIAACMPYLERQIALINPSIIVALGKTAALSLLQLAPETPVGKLRGKVHRYAGLPLIVTYHPAYLLRSLGDKRKAWADLCLAMQTHAADAGE